MSAESTEREKPMKRIAGCLKCLAYALVLSTIAPHSQAQQYPNRAIRMVLPFAAGGGTDTFMRVLVQGMNESPGHTYILDNRPSDGGNVSLAFVAKADPDGYTIAVSTPIIAVNPILYPRVQYRSGDFSAISLLGRAPALIVMNPQVPARNVAELIRLAKSRPGSLSYGAPTGSGPYLAMEMFRAMAEIDVRHIPYKSTTTVAIDMMGGVIDMASMTAPSVIGLVRANKLRAIAQTGETRLAIVADVPTLDEAGLKGFNVTTWYMALGPAKLPAAIANHLNGEFVKALNLPDVRKRSLENGVDEIIGSSAQDASVFLRDESVRWAKVLKPIPE